MKFVYSRTHLLHNPLQEIEKSTAHSPYEHSGRGEAIREVLVADQTMSMVSPSEWGTAPIDAVHNPGLSRFLSTAWDDYQRTNGPRREVVPDFFYRNSMRDGMREGIEPESINGKLGWWCFETTTPLTSGSYSAACGAVNTALTATQLVLNGEKMLRYAPITWRQRPTQKSPSWMWIITMATVRSKFSTTATMCSTCHYMGTHVVLIRMSRVMPMKLERVGVWGAHSTFRLLPVRMTITIYRR